RARRGGSRAAGRGRPLRHAPGRRAVGSRRPRGGRRVARGRAPRGGGGAGGGSGAGDAGARVPGRRRRRPIADVVRGRRRMNAVWIMAGLVGGAIAGLVDAGVNIAGGIGGMSVGKALRLIALSASLVAAAGGIGGVAIAALARLT